MNNVSMNKVANAMTTHENTLFEGLSRRTMLRQLGAGFGLVGLAGVLADADARGATVSSDSPLSVKPTHFPARAKRVIHLFMNGGPSHVDTFDPKPALEKFAGQKPEELTKNYQRAVGPLFPSPYKFAKHGQAGLDVSELFPHMASQIDDICVIRSMYTDIPNQIGRAHV